MKGSIALCSADNLGSQELGGFKLGGSSFRMCRHCLGTDLDIQSKEYYHHVVSCECDFDLRTRDQYRHHCDLIESDTNLSSHYSTTYGINNRSILDSLSYFCVAEGAMIPDVMHDILEGVLPLELKLILKVRYQYMVGYCIFILDIHYRIKIIFNRCN